MGVSDCPQQFVLPLFMLSSNQVLHQGRYRIIDQFGDVDSGRLYEAYDTVSDTKVVLRETVGQLGKVATAAQIENFKTAFAADAKRLADVEHPSLLKIKDYFSEIDRQYLVMEACEGSDLTSLISGQEKGPGAADILRWADQLLDGLHYLHTQDPAIIHRNVSPRNARLTSNFKVKLLISGGSHENGSMDSETTTSDDADLPYKSLEQLWRGLDSASRKMIANSFGEESEEVLRQDLDARTDVYSVGAVTYFLLTKTEPADALARYLEILDGNDDPLQNPTDLNESIPAEVSHALMKALELKREDRFGSASEMRAELAKVKMPTRLAEVRTTPSQVADAPPAAQDTHFEEERLRVEKERRELEAEQKRLEEERVGIEKRKLELEAEKKRTAQLIAAKRLEDERQKTAKLNADKAKADKLEAENAAAAKVKAVKAAAEGKARIAQLAKESPKNSISTQPEVEKMQMDLAHDDLLDLPVIETSVEPNVSTDVLALEVERPATVQTQTDSSFDLYSSEISHKSFISRPPVLVGLAAALLVSVAGIWMFMGAGRSATPASSPAATVQTESPKLGDREPTQSAENPVVESNSAFASQTDQQVAGSTPGVESKVEQDAKQKPKKQPTPQAKPSPGKTKKVTVDDLINDN